MSVARCRFLQRLGNTLVFLLPRAAMLARYMLSSCVRLFVRLSVISRYCVKTTGRIEVGFGADATFHLSHTVL